MRYEFARFLAGIADNDSRIVLITADLGYHVLDEFRSRHPDKFINAGVAEQLMIGMATGMAKEGFRPWCYSIAPFALLRPLEFIKNGPVHHKLPVKIVGVGVNDEYLDAGQTHWLTVETAHHACLSIGLHYSLPIDVQHLTRIMDVEYTCPTPTFLHLSKQ